MLSARKKLILLKTETTYGTDAAPGATNAMLASNVSITPLEAETVSRDLIRPYMGADQVLHVGEHISITFSVENQSSGTAGTAPAFSPALRAAGMLETVDAGVDVTYRPRSDSFESCTVYFYMDTVLHKAVGVRGTFGFGYEPKGLSRLNFTMLGLYAGPVTGAMPTPDWTAWKNPLPVGPTSTSAFQLHGYSAIAHKLDIEAGFTSEFFQTLTTEEIRMSDRSSSGSVTIDAPALADIDFIERVRTNQMSNLTLTHGKTAGSIVELAAPNVQLLTPKYGEASGVTTLEMGFNLVPTAAGNDEFSLTYK
jgi:hypothetical protein